MKTLKSIFILVVGVFSLLFFSCTRETVKKESLVIYAYDSFVSEWGPAPRLSELYKQEKGRDVNFISVGDSGQVLARAILEKNSPKADLVIGIDNNLLPKALQAGIFEAYRSKALEKVPEKLLFDPSFTVIPYDYGFFAVIYDSRKITSPPLSLEDLTDSRFKNSLILMDPRTSTPGLGFLLWSVARFGEDYLTYWERLKPSILTVTEGWDSGYGMFTTGEAPMVLSYTSSPAYHKEYEDTDHFRAALFPEGHYAQIEGVALVRKSSRKEEARDFIDFLLSPEAQEILPLTNWMYPVVEDVKLPESYDIAPIPEKLLLLDPESIESNTDSWIKEWVDLLSR